MAMSGQAKSSATTMNPMVKAGSGWDYDQIDITYDGGFDAEGRRVLYDSIGEATTLTAQSKNSATMTGQTKT
jgi:hypothetical protein